jgi:hypothetical protein
MVVKTGRVMCRCPQVLVSMLFLNLCTHLHALPVSHSSPQVPDATPSPSPRTQDHLLVHHQTASHTTAPNSTPASHPTSSHPLAPAPHPDPHTHTQRLPATTTAGSSTARPPIRATQISSTTNGRLIHLFVETAQLLRLAVPQTLNPAAANGGRAGRVGTGDQSCVPQAELEAPSGSRGGER